MQGRRQAMDRANGVGEPGRLRQLGVEVRTGGLQERRDIEEGEELRFEDQASAGGPRARL